jgi:hypothetical protein
LRIFDRNAYFIAFISSALAMILLIAESAYHQLRGKPDDKALMLRTARLQLGGGCTRTSRRVVGQ